VSGSCVATVLLVTTLVALVPLSRERMSKRERENEGGESESELNADAQLAVDTELLEACRSATVEEVKAALRKGANFLAVTAKDRSGLLLACRREPCEAAVAIVKLLLRKKSPVTQSDWAGLNALHHACRCSSADVVKLLLEVCSSAASRLSDESCTALMFCVQHRDVDEAVKIATLLLDAGCNIGAVNENASSALLWAAQVSSTEMVSLLIARGADVTAQSAGPWTALHFACMNGAGLTSRRKAPDRGQLFTLHV
jgi:ankyrin repeat protein